MKEKIKNIIFYLKWGQKREEVIINEEMFDYFYNSDTIDYTNI